MVFTLQQQDKMGIYSFVRSDRNYESILEAAYSMLDEAKDEEYNIYLRIIDEKGKDLFTGECINGRISYI